MISIFGYTLFITSVGKQGTFKKDHTRDSWQAIN